MTDTTTTPRRKGPPPPNPWKALREILNIVADDLDPPTRDQQARKPGLVVAAVLGHYSLNKARLHRAVTAIDDANAKLRAHRDVLDAANALAEDASDLAAELAKPWYRRNSRLVAQELRNVRLACERYDLARTGANIPPQQPGNIMGLAPVPPANA